MEFSEWNWISQDIYYRLLLFSLWKNFGIKDHVLSDVFTNISERKGIGMLWNSNISVRVKGDDSDLGTFDLNESKTIVDSSIEFNSTKECLIRRDFSDRRTIKVLKQPHSITQYRKTINLKWMNPSIRLCYRGFSKD